MRRILLRVGIRFLKLFISEEQLVVLVADELFPSHLTKITLLPKKDCLDAYETMDDLSRSGDMEFEDEEDDSGPLLN